MAGGANEELISILSRRNMNLQFIIDYETLRKMEPFFDFSCLEILLWALLQIVLWIPHWVFSGNI